MLVPRLKSISQEVHLDDNIKNNITKDFKSEFYFDMIDGNICCDVKYIYDDEDKLGIAKKYYKKAIEKNPNYDKAYFFLIYLI